MNRSSTLSRIRVVMALALLSAAPAALAQYSLQGLGLFDGMSSEAVAINDAGQVAGTRLGT